jgi:ketosteroid isomerase-like protein
VTGTEDDLVGRLRRVEDQLAIERTMARYAHAIDYGDEAGWVGCFTADAAFEVRSRWAEPAPKRIEGHAALARFVARHSRAPLLWHKHIAWAIVVDLDGDAATSRAQFAALVEHGEAPVIKVFGRYLDRLAREADGEWRFTERIAEAESITPGAPPLSYAISELRGVQ